VIDRRIAVALIGRLWRQHRLVLLTMAVGLALFQFVITRVAPAPGQAGFIGGLLGLLPPQVSAFVGGDLGLASPRGVIAFGYLHPFFLAIFSAWTIRVASGALAGEIGRGTMDLLAARPVPRWAHVVAAWIVIGMGLAVLAATAWAGTGVGLRLRSLEVTGRQVIVLPAMAWLQFLAWASVVSLISALRRDAGSAIAWASGVIATSFVLEFLARVWQPIEWARPFSLFTYYRPPEIMRSGIALADPLWMGLVAVIGLIAAVAVFRRRDL
jgi:ABC-2 type transport system permease protein